MKLLMLCMVMILLVGCGQVSQPSTSSKQEEKNQEEMNPNHQTNTNDEEQNTSSKQEEKNQQEMNPNHQTNTNGEEQNTYFIDLPHMVQENAYYCGPAALQSVLSYHGINYSQDELANLLHTSSLTGTEYADLARVATSLIFPNGNGKYQFVLPNETHRQQFEQHLIEDLKNNDPVFVSIDNFVMYEDCPSAVHQVVVNGVVIENDKITTIYFMDPSYTRQDATYGALKKTTMDQLWNAMIQNKEPGYVY